MKKNISHIVFSTGLLLSGFLLATKVIASGECTPLYGGGYTCPKHGEILIDKQIKHPTKDLFVDNLTEFDTKFAPNQEITFRIFVRNTGNDTINQVEVKDIFPDFFSFVSGPGNFDPNEGKNGTLTFTLYNLAAGESREYWIIGKIYNEPDLPETTICKLPNRAQARASDDRFNEDVAEYCVEKEYYTTKGGVPVKQIPVTGPSGQLLTFLSFSTLLGIGFMLRGKAIKGLK